MLARDQHQATSLACLSLFTGVGGLDLGIERAGHVVVQQCEIWPPARRVLLDRFGHVPIHDDVQTLRATAPFDLLLAGFPCTDISHAGRRTGITGDKSRLVSEVFRIAEMALPKWILLENVPNLLTLHAGDGMRVITERLEELGYSWAYRTVDSRFTGVPQRRPRILILAGRDADPRGVLLAQDAARPETATTPTERTTSGFYWTEGRTGVGLVSGAIPTLKGGSTLGLPSAPAIWVPDADLGRRFVLPSIEDGEALQGLPRGWTASAVVDGEPDLRWKLVGNAVTVGIGSWIGRRLALNDAEYSGEDDPVVNRSVRWPPAGWGDGGRLRSSSASAWPETPQPQPLSDVIDFDTAKPLSHRATSGFLSRLDEVGRKVPAAFYADLEAHQAATRPSPQLRANSTSEAPVDLSPQPSQKPKPEARLEAALRALGLEFETQRRPELDLRWRPHFILPVERIAVDLRSCFWHGCPAHGTSPKANLDRWAGKLARNVERDRKCTHELRARGWIVRVVWEHDDPADAAARIARAARRRTSMARTESSA